MVINVHERPRLPSENPGEQHLACVVLVDTSDSMNGYEQDLMTAISNLKTAIMEDDIARGRVEICLITFDDEVREASPFGPISQMEVPQITCGGMTCTHSAIQFALNRIAERKEEYKKNGITYNCPWIWLLTDGQSNDPDNGSFERLLQAQKESRCAFFGVAVGDGVNEKELASLHKNGMLLKAGKDNLASLFEWIGQSINTASVHNPGKNMRVPVPNGIDVQYANAESQSKADAMDSKEELILKADAGDVDAMIKLVNAYIDEKDWNEAIDWADKASESGNVNAMYKAVNLHAIRMHALVAMGMLSGLMPDDAKAVQTNSAVLIGASNNGTINLSAEMYSQLLSDLRDGIYFEAVSCYFAKPSDYNRIVHLLKDLDTAREQFLCGCAYFELKQYDDALLKLNEAFNDREYQHTEKELPEDCLFATAMHILSDMERVNGNCDKAVMVLNSAIESVSDEAMKDDLQKQLGRYQKKMFGGWKYT